MTQKRTCSVDGCSLDQWARGWCCGHYQRWRRTGDPLAAEREFPPLDEAFGHWFAGFFAGEGSLLIKNKPQAPMGSPVSCIDAPCDDRPILEEIAQRLDMGKLLDLKGRGRTSPSTRWIVDNKDECRRLVEIFDAHPIRAKKARDYVVWRQAVSYWCSLPRGKRWSGRGQGSAEFARLKREIQDVRLLATLF
jgi:hypothetical protein